MEKDVFKNLSDVLVYLKAAGWQVTRTSLYRHHKEGKLLPEPGGAYAQKATDKYAKTWLKQKSTGKKISEKYDDLQRTKLEIEIENLDYEKRRKKRLEEKEIGDLVPREQLEYELVAWAGVLQGRLKHRIQSCAAERIRLVNGDMKKVGELINRESRDLDEDINECSRIPKHQIVIDAAEEEMETETDQ